MKKLIKLILSIVSLVNLIYSTSIAQTNVSGGIYANTTWTLANSPYIVVDTVVVFPGHTLTIEPGVVVKFDDNKYIELRQASLIALGTITDSITFTSNSGSPTAGSWKQIIQTGVGSHTCKFSYCNFRYATTGFFANGTTPTSDSIFVKHSIFEYNSTGFSGQGKIEFIDSCNFFQNTVIGLHGAGDVNHCVAKHNNYGVSFGYNELKNCVIDSNQTGLSIISATVSNCLLRNNQTGIEVAFGSLIDSCTVSRGQLGIYGDATITNCIVDSNSMEGILVFDGTDTIINCEIKYNGIGINDSLSSGLGLITRNQIENNNIGIVLATSQDTIYCNKICNNTFYDLKYLGANNTNCVTNNYWCTSDSAILESHIYDGYDNISDGIVSFFPIDTLQCYLHIDVPFIENENSTVTLYPNPTANNFTVSINAELKNACLEIYNVLGEKVYIERLSTKQKTLNTNFHAGIYLVKVSDGQKNIVRKLVVE